MSRRATRCIVAASQSPQPMVATVVGGRRRRVGFVLHDRCERERVEHLGTFWNTAEHPGTAAQDRLLAASPGDALETNLLLFDHRARSPEIRRRCAIGVPKAQRSAQKRGSHT